MSERGSEEAVAEQAPTVEELWALFPAAGPLPRITVVPPEAMPAGCRRLLAHDRHMTVALEDRHRAPVVLRVLETSRRGAYYARRLVLTAGVDGPTTLYGVVRIHFAALAHRVQEEILAAKTPLGSILIAHDVLRRIEPLNYLRVEPTDGLQKVLGLREVGELYGRLATIHCDELRAVDLLEIVAL